MLSVVVLTKNEEQMIRGCLESVKWANEIIIVDSGSTDKTLDIAREYGAKIINEDSDDFSVRRTSGIQAATSDWVLYVDADERVLKPLREELFGIFEDSKYSAYALSRRNIIFGEEVHYKAFWPDWMIRLVYKKDFKRWVGRVHEYMQFDGDLGYTKNSLLHLTHRSLDHFFGKALTWSKIDARLRIDANHPKMTKWRFLRILITSLFDELIKRKGLFGGTVGMMDSILQSFSFFMTYVRLWEMQQKTPLSDKYADIDQKLIENKFEY